MAYRIYETTTHDFDPVNKYIDEKARLRRTKVLMVHKSSRVISNSIWFISDLAAYAYHIFKKPHDRVVVEDRIINQKKKLNKT